MKLKHKKKPSHQLEIASERIKKLFDEAEEASREDMALADRYVHIARKISMKYKVKIPTNLKRRFCKHCHSYLMSNKTCRIRLNKGKVVYYCLKCKKFMRFPTKIKGAKRV